MDVTQENSNQYKQDSTRYPLTYGSYKDAIDTDVATREEAIKGNIPWDGVNISANGLLEIADRVRADFEYHLSNHTVPSDRVFLNWEMNGTLAVVYCHIANSQYWLGNNIEALRYLRKALDIAIEYDLIYAQIEAKTHMVNPYVASDNIFAHHPLNSEYAYSLIMDALDLALDTNRVGDITWIIKNYVKAGLSAGWDYDYLHSLLKSDERIKEKWIPKPSLLSKLGLTGGATKATRASVKYKPELAKLINRKK